MRGVDDKNLRDYVQDYQEIINDFEVQRNLNREKATISYSLMQSYNKKIYDKRHKSPKKYKEGDLVLIKLLTLLLGLIKSFCRNTKALTRFLKF